MWYVGIGVWICFCLIAFAVAQRMSWDEFKDILVFILTGTLLGLFIIGVVLGVTWIVVMLPTMLLGTNGSYVSAAIVAAMATGGVWGCFYEECHDKIKASRSTALVFAAVVPVLIMASKL